MSSVFRSTVSEEGVFFGNSNAAHVKCLGTLSCILKEIIEQVDRLRPEVGHLKQLGREVETLKKGSIVN